jgi:hypothetical protein
LFLPLPVLFQAQDKRSFRHHQANRHFGTTRQTVISTEAAHGIIVSTAAEKSASQPPPFANQRRALVLPSPVAQPSPRVKP